MKALNVLRNVVLTSSLIFAGTAVQAQDYENVPNVYLGLSGYFPESDRRLDDSTGMVFGGEMPLSGRWSLNADYFIIDSEVQSAPYDADVDYFRLGVNYHFNKLRDWQPYAGLGFGQIDINRETGGPADFNDSAVDFGVGLKRVMDNNIMLRGDFKFVDDGPTQEMDKLVTVGVAYASGARPATTAARAEMTTSTTMDSDNDGVADSSDACRNTPNGVQVDRRGCEIDSDRDSVVDSRDSCPDTPANLAVDNRGCPILEATQRSIELLVNFDYDKSDVKPQYDEEIEEFADFMETYGNTNAVIEGHTDNRGSDAYNQALSERRARAVRNELVNEHGIDSDRVSAVGYGESRPVDTSNTEAGHARNRRIEAVLSVEVEEQRRR